MGGQYAYPDDPTRLQGGLCANNARAWDALTEGPVDTHKMPSPGQRDGWELAKDMCLDCPIFVRCYEQRMQHRHGVWGGTDQLERHNQRKAAQRAAAKERAKEKAAEPVAAPQAVPEPVLAVARTLRPFPVEDPPGYDGWIRDGYVVRSAFYAAQDAQGCHVKVKLKGDRAPIVKWLQASDVDLRRSVTKCIAEPPKRLQKEEGHGVQGTIEASAAA